MDNNIRGRGGFRGEGGGDVFSSGIRPPPDPKGPPFELFWDIPFLADRPNNFSKGAYGGNVY